MLVLAHDWIGPEGPWPNGQTLDFYANKDNYEKSYYSISNKHQYDLESRRHLFTYSKIQPIVGKNNFIRKHITECEGKFIYELTPLLKPYQWTEEAFDNVSKIAIEKQQQNMCLFVINDLNEGYSNTEYNFYKNLHVQIDRYKLKAQNVIYFTMNSVSGVEYSKWCNTNNIKNKIRIIPIFIFEHSSNKNKIRTPNKHFICLNRQPNPHRQCLVYELWRRDLLKYGHVSMPDINVPLDVSFEKKNLKLFDLDDTKWDEFIQSLPYEVDGRDFTAQNCDFNSISDYYQDSVYAVVTENTVGEEDCIKLSEKTFTAFDNYCLPLHYYSPGITKQLLNIGYTLDFSFDNRDYKQRFYDLIDTIERICQIPIEELHNTTKNIRIKNYNNIKNRDNSYRERINEIFKEWHEY
jgi:hypothetical protein